MPLESAPEPRHAEGTGPVRGLGRTKGMDMNDLRMPLRALVVYESMFGNTENIARAVAEGLQLDEVVADVVAVADAPHELPAGLDLLVVGAPTRAFSLSRLNTRRDAVRQGASPTTVEIGLREWLTNLSCTGPLPPLAVFDTRVTKVRRLPMAAGPAAARVARRRGFSLATNPVGFLVDDLKGPLVDNETPRATAWGQRLAGLCRLHRAAAAGRGAST